MMPFPASNSEVKPGVGDGIVQAVGAVHKNQIKRRLAAQLPGGVHKGGVSQLDGGLVEQRPAMW